eukprot:TRINITY_DN4769_c0_g1_i1.p1 TRINITY_DN4769_c0_g1~~TRINITY_DN4769_c0_g1_i1.p1  ORF type:complete len:250 (-),score=30.89 TRINITY_DN4769_c0_g1_i1:84-833(-)
MAREVHQQMEMGGDPEGDSRLATGKLSSVPPSVRSDFIRKVYSILSAQLLVTTAIVCPFFIYVNQEWVLDNIAIFWGANALSLAMICGVSCCCTDMLRKFPMNFIFLTVFAVAWGVILGFVTSLYTLESVGLAAGMTAAIFIGLTIYACTTKTDFTGLGPYLYGALLCLMLFGLVTFFVNSDIWQKVYAGLGALLFCFYIIYDTQLIVGGNHSREFSVDDYCLAALTLYIDIINLFLYLLELFGQRDGS